MDEAELRVLPFRLGCASWLVQVAAIALDGRSGPGHVPHGGAVQVWEERELHAHQAPVRRAHRGAAPRLLRRVPLRVRRAPGPRVHSAPAQHLRLGADAPGARGGVPLQQAHGGAARPQRRGGVRRLQPRLLRPHPPHLPHRGGRDDRGGGGEVLRADGREVRGHPVPGGVGAGDDGAHLRGGPQLAPHGPPGQQAPRARPRGPRRAEETQEAPLRRPRPLRQLDDVLRG
mmetsp:Transcript_22800/g.49991  ORF Transcript_22800/g.49991 Transcript_22800/m.49991 type:complete len:230 (+) Transcript_22800:748-1437(+)